jgi:hypothetical protein
VRPDHDTGHLAGVRHGLECAAMPVHVPKPRPSRSLAVACGATVLACVFAWAPAWSAAAVYKWIDDDGVTHLSSERPPSGIRYERVAVGAPGGGKQASSTRGGGTAVSNGNVRLAAVSPEQVARRNAVISELQNRECVVALESMDRLARSGRPVEPTEFRRLQQTADLNCSKEPAARRQQEEQAAKLRVAKGDVCVEARNKLADMLEPGRRPTREQLKVQQEFIESHCKVPVR